jgi:hypothetical protein
LSSMQMASRPDVRMQVAHEACPTRWVQRVTQTGS